MKIKNVLSLFGGIETGLVALKELGCKIDNYFSSEIDKWAKAVARFNHSEICHVGNIKNYSSWIKDLPKIDLILAGPPCQGFSRAGKGLNWDDPRSQLFFTAIEILWMIQKVNQDVKFLFENVASMKKEIRSEIDELMEVDSVKINSCLVSAQDRKRVYWCNWNVDQPKDKGIFLKDIIKDGYCDKPKSFQIDKGYYQTSISSPARYFIKYSRQIVFRDKAKTIFSTIYKENVKSFINRKKYCLMAADYYGLIRKLYPSECALLQTLDEDYCKYGNFNGVIKPISNTRQYMAYGNGWTKEVIKHILSCSYNLDYKH